MSNDFPMPESQSSNILHFRLLLQRTSPPPQIIMPEILSQDCITNEEREMMERIGKMAEEAVMGLRTVKHVGSLLVSLDVDN